ncbi:MAG TPA: ParB/RepB/Spo0J family partition protein [Chloroflexia bacterium]|nr:ParB/RepB/Spo0J family partition protein [Chloroflexia bacterium]
MGRTRVPARAGQSLIAASPEEGVQPLKDAKRIDIDLIQGDPRQPRKHFDEEAMAELIASVRERGILQPITVQKRPDGSGYFVVTGERRLRAARAAGLDTVPALVVDLSDTDMRLDRVIENRQRKDLTDLEFARAITEIRVDLGSQAPHLSSNELDEHVGQRLGISGRTVRNFAALLNLDPAIESMLGEMLTELRTRGLARIGYDRELQLQLAEAIREHNLSGRQTLAAAQLLKRHLGLTVPEAVARVLQPEAGAAPVEATVAVVPATPASAPLDQTDETADGGVDGGLDPNDPQRRYWLLMAYLSRSLTVLDEPGADDEVPLTQGQVQDLALLLDGLVELRARIDRAVQYLAQREAAGQPGHEDDPLPRKVSVMLPYGGQKGR